MAGSNIPWRQSLESAQAEAKGTGKLVLVDIFSPT